MITTLRPMTMFDAELMLGWKNDEETRKYAIATSEEIKPAAHYAWLEHNVQFFQTIEDMRKVPVGAIRVQNGEISIWVDRAVRGNGIARDTIRKVSHTGQTAKIVEGNIPSMRAFIFSGFAPTVKLDNYYIFKKA